MPQRKPPEPQQPERFDNPRLMLARRQAIIAELRKKGYEESGIFTDVSGNTTITQYTVPGGTGSKSQIIMLMVRIPQRELWSWVCYPHLQSIDSIIEGA